MKSIHDPNLISHYITQFNLDQVFTTSTHALIQLLVYEQDEIILREGDELDGIYFQVRGVPRFLLVWGRENPCYYVSAHPCHYSGILNTCRKL